jgi:hypothetical protein
MKNDQRQRESVRAENLSSTTDYVESSTYTTPPDSDYGSDGWGFDVSRACKEKAPQLWGHCVQRLMAVFDGGCHLVANSGPCFPGDGEWGRLQSCFN